MAKLVLELEGERELVGRRRFAAPPEAVFRAHVTPELLCRWMLGPDGWVMTECVSDARPGGAMAFAWEDGAGKGFRLTGEYKVVEPSTRIVHVERMHLPEPTPDNHVETTFEVDGAGTLMTLRMTMPDATVRAAMLETGMEHGMEASYARLDGLAL